MVLSIRLLSAEENGESWLNDQLGGLCRLRNFVEATLEAYSYLLHLSFSGAGTAIDYDEQNNI